MRWGDTWTHLTVPLQHPMRSCAGALLLLPTASLNYTACTHVCTRCLPPPRPYLALAPFPSHGPSIASRSPTPCVPCLQSKSVHLLAVAAPPVAVQQVYLLCSLHFGSLANTFTDSPPLCPPSPVCGVHAACCQPPPLANSAGAILLKYAVVTCPTASTASHRTTLTMVVVVVVARIKAHPQPARARWASLRARTSKQRGTVCSAFRASFTATGGFQTAWMVQTNQMAAA